MTNTMSMMTIWALVLLTCTVAWSREARYFESFEEGVPDYFAASRAESLSISPWHYKHGGHSLRWDWVAGDEIVIHHGIGDVERTGGFRAKAGFSVWLYMDEPVADALVFEFRRGEQVTGSFRFPLEFTGWRQGRLHFDSFPEGRPTAEVDSIRILGPTAVERGTVLLDFIKYNTLTARAYAVIPEREMQWQRPAPDPEGFPRPEQVTEAEHAGIRKLLGPDEGPGIAQDKVDDLCSRVDALGIVRDEHGVRGPGIDAHLQFFPSSEDAAALGVRVEYWPDEHGPHWEGMQTPAAMSSLALNVATAYRASNDAEQRRRLSEAFLLIADHLHDQALQAGSGFRWNWWYGGSWADAVGLMRDVLAETGRLQAHSDYLLYTWGGDVMFAEGESHAHMDFYNLTVPRLVWQCLLQVEPAEQVRWLNALKAMLDRLVASPRSAFKIDGSAYHHSGHYPSYAAGAFHNLGLLMLRFDGTPWRLSAEAHERFRRAVLAQRIYSNLLDVPASLHGRSTLRGARRINLSSLQSLSLCGTPDGGEDIDPEVAAAYLRLAPDAADAERLREQGIEPEAHPNGTFVMPYAGLLSHRVDDWLVSVKGQSKYVWASERQDHHNRFGILQGIGQVEILAGGAPVTAEASGRQRDGWDWCRFEGTTAPQLPADRLVAGWRSPSGVTYSPEGFMGGLAHRRSRGVFGMILNHSIRPATSLAARKSWFFTGNQVICLGSDIVCDEPEYPTQTTLCQRGLAAGDDGAPVATLLDGAEFAGFPEERVLDQSEAHWFIDVQQTGYYLPEGQDVTVVRRHQENRDSWDLEDTEGDFLTAWIDHGIAPDGAGYEYMLLVRATPETMQALTAELPYTVVRRDSEAHIVYHDGEGWWGCVFFVEQETAPHAVGADSLPVKSVDRACLVMVETTEDGQLALSVADPDLHADPPAGNHIVSEPRPLRVTLRGIWRVLEASGAVGEWELEGASEGIRVISADVDETVLEIVCDHGASYDIRLTR